MLGDTVKCHVNDLVIKSCQRIDHLEHLKVVLDKHRHYQLKMNLLNCEFLVTLEKLLGFMVRNMRIKVDPAN